MSEPLLELLRHRYGHRWHIHRSGSLWHATATDPDTDYAPTIIEPEAEEFVRQLENPPARQGRSILSMGWIAHHLTEITDGVYHGSGH